MLQIDININDEAPEPKLVYRHDFAYDKRIVDYSKNLDCTGYQNSKYLVIDSDIKQFKKNYEKYKEQ